MKAKELIAALQEMDPEADVLTGVWNGHVDTYSMVDRAREFNRSDIWGDLFGTPGAIDGKVLTGTSKKVVYIASELGDKDDLVFEDRRIHWRLLHILERHKSVKWKKDRIYAELWAFLKQANE